LAFGPLTWKCCAATTINTLQHWCDLFAANRGQVVAIAGERFCRMWEYNLAAVQVGFCNGSNVVFQLLLSQRIDSVPIVRDFMMVGARSSMTSGDSI
jgi:cyclopropane-fatty-acyl-phospholipid synthase